MRVVSLVPSLTELLCDLGIKDKIVACTQFCVRPADLHRKTTLVGGTKNPDLQKIKELKPSHILVNLEENRVEDLAELRMIAPLVETAPCKPDDVPKMILAISDFLGLESEGSRLANSIEEILVELQESKKSIPKKSVLYFIWRDPWMLAGKNTYISSMLELMGMENVAWQEERYPCVELNELQRSKFDMVLLSSEPWPFRKRDCAPFSNYIDRSTHISWIDGRLMSWYGSSTLEALKAIKNFNTNLKSPLFKSLR